ncbi:LamG domain-containing protein [Flindersiella endophytica]
MFGALHQAPVSATMRTDISADRSVVPKATPRAAVAVPELTTETQKVTAEVDGSYTAEVSAWPVRVKDSGGSWRDVNTGLTGRVDGSVGPAVAPVELAFSGGGSTSLVDIDEDGKGFALSWPDGPLPAPVLAGETATYPNVLPDVDLVLEAGATGFASYFVVKTPAAAANPALATLRLTVEGDDLSLSTDADGGLVAKDASGRVRFSGAPPLMWDSTGADTTSSASVIEQAQEAKSAPVQVSVSGNTMTITPDQGLLSDPDVTFPLVIDPAVSRSQKRTYWAMVWENGYRFINSSTQVARVGYESSQNKNSKVFYRFDTSAFAGKHILSATFRHAQNHSWYNTCGGTRPEGVILSRTGSISSSTRWPGPNPIQDLGTDYKSHGNRKYCPGFTETEWNAEPAVEAVAAARSSTLTLGMRSTDPGNVQGWRKFSTNSSYPVLTVQYNTPPDTPSSVRIQDPSTSCVSSQADAPFISSVTPRLQARLTDPDGSSAKLRGRFEVYEVGGSAPAWAATTSVAVSSGTTEYLPVPAGELTSGHVYRLRVQAQESTSEGTDGSAWSGWCYFRPDISYPPPPSVVGDPYCEQSSNQNCTGAYGGVGQVGAFTIDSSATDVVEYRWQLNGRDWKSAYPSSAGAPVVVQIWPDFEAVNVLKAVAIDRAGNTSTTNYYSFNVAGGAPPSGVWKLDESSGTTAADTAGGTNVRNLTLQGGSWSELGRRGNSLLLDGVDDYATASGSAVSTFNSFAVGAWVRLDSNAANQAIARQATTDGVHEFLLYYSKSSDRWAFQKQNQDNLAFAGTVYSKTAPALGVWTHVLGVYDGSANQIRLYINGVLQNTYQMTSPAWFAGGRFEVGSWNYPGIAGAPFKGRIDEVRVWNRWLAPQEVAKQADIKDAANKDAPELVAQWTFDDKDTPSRDSAGYGFNLALASGAQVVEDRDGGGVLQVTGDANGYARGPTGTPIVDGTGSFTITAWVKPTDASHNGAVVAQGNTAKDTFDLGTSRSSPVRWRFGRTNAGTGSAEVVSDDALAGEDYSDWTHIAAVYNRVDGRIFLYVNGVRQDIEDGAAYADPWHATSAVMLGREWAGVDTSTSFAGRIDDVRLYTGVMDQDDIYLQWYNG